VLPDDWGQDKIQKALLWGEQIGNPLRVERAWSSASSGPRSRRRHPLRRAVVLRPLHHDRILPVFPRGVTRGMVEDLIDPQREKNKSRNARIEIEAKTANGGWKYHEDSLDPVQERNLKKFGSAPGVNIKWKGDKAARADPAASAADGLREARARADEDVRRISGINESALGEVDIAGASGRAIEARQRQAVVSVQMYMTTSSARRCCSARNHLYIIQNYYTEQRIYRITGDDGKDAQVMINQMMPTRRAAASASSTTSRSASIHRDVDERRCPRPSPTRSSRR
jgi:hypothetical protein